MTTEERIRNRKSYKDFDQLYAILQEPKEKNLRFVFELLDKKQAFHSRMHSNYAKESLELLLKDKK